MEQGRNQVGQFSAKGEGRREVRSIRLTNSTWEKLGDIADERSITRADLIEEIMSGEGLGNNLVMDSTHRQVNFPAIINILESALKLKANAGGAIKEKIKEALKLL
jgi:predicted DNA-binding ribbon-helix-helix protein